MERDPEKKRVRHEGSAITLFPMTTQRGTKQGHQTTQILECRQKCQVRAIGE